MLTPLNFATKIVLGPSWRMLSRSDWSNPRMSDVMPTIAVMPMTTPRTVSAERSLFTRRVSSASVTTSPKRAIRAAARRAPILFAPQRFDRVQPRGSRCRIQSEEETNRGGDPDAEGHGPQLEARGQRRDGGGDPAESGG